MDVSSFFTVMSHTEEMCPKCGDGVLTSQDVMLQTQTEISLLRAERCLTCDGD